MDALTGCTSPTRCAPQPGAATPPTRGSALGLGRGDLLDDVLRVPAHAGDYVRRKRVLEDQAHEVQAGLGADNPAIVDRQAVLAEDREFDPPIVLPEAVHQMTFATSTTRP